MAFFPDGKVLASGGADSTVKLWDVAKRRVQHNLSGHTGEVWALAFAPDGELVASGSEDRTLRLWNVQTGIEEATLTRNAGSVRQVNLDHKATSQRGMYFTVTRVSPPCPELEDVIRRQVHSESPTCQIGRWHPPHIRLLGVCDIQISGILWREDLLLGEDVCLELRISFGQRFKASNQPLMSPEQDEAIFDEQPLCFLPSHACVPRRKRATHHQYQGACPTQAELPGYS